MDEHICMGNDEFILYLRKNYPLCTLTNDQAGKRIYVWLRDNADGSKTAEDVSCSWGANATGVGETRLPKTATQFRFRRGALSMLYDFLDRLGQE